MNNFTELSQSSIIEVKGNDYKKFLQGQLTQDIEKLSNTQGSISAYCNAKGRMIALFEMIENNKTIYLLIPDQTADLMLEIIKKYAMFSKVTLTKNNHLKTYALWGENAEQLLKENFNTELTKPYDTFSNEKLMIIRLKTAIPAFKIISHDKIEFKNLENQNENAWQHFLISQKIPVIFSENSEYFLPAELELDQLKAISLSKGCYVGQEVIARMHYLGQSKKTLIQARAEGNLAEINLKDRILDENNKLVGEVVNFEISNEDKNKANLLIVAMKKALEIEANWHISDNITVTKI